MTPQTNQRGYVAWICDSCGDQAEAEPGEPCEYDEECGGTVRAVAVVPDDAEELREIAQELEAAREAWNERDHDIADHRIAEVDRRLLSLLASRHSNDEEPDDG